MNRAQRYIVLLFVLAASMVPCRAFAFLGLEAGVGYWQQTPSGSFGYNGDSLDLKNDLNYGNKSQVFARVKVDLPLILPNLYFMATPMSFDGTGKKNLNFNYGGQTYQGSVPFESKLKLDHYDLALYYPIPFLKTATLGMLNIDLGLNVRNINFEGTVTQASTNLSESKTMALYIPMVYAGVQFKPISVIAIEAEGRGIAIGQNHYYDYMGKLKYYPIGPLYIAGGYRTEDIKIDQSGVLAGIKFAGPFGEVGLTF